MAFYGNYEKDGSIYAESAQIWYRICQQKTCIKKIIRQKERIKSAFELKIISLVGLLYDKAIVNAQQAKHSDVSRMQNFGGTNH